MIVDLEGPIEHDGRDDGVLLDGIRRLLDNGHKYLLLNVAQLTHADTVMLGAIVRSYTSATLSGGTLKLLNVSKRFRELLAVTRLDQILDIVESEGAAITRFPQR